MHDKRVLLESAVYLLNKYVYNGDATRGLMMIGNDTGLRDKMESG